MKTNNNSRFTFFFFVIAALIALATRWLPHADNFSAMGGLIFLAGYLFLRDKAVLPIAFMALFVSDMMIGTYQGIEWTYLGYVAVLLSGWLVAPKASRPSYLVVGLSNVFAAFAFFLISNFGVWMSSGIYPKTLEGLVDCYVMALPFAQTNTFSQMTLISQVVVGVAFVFAYERIAQKVEVVSKGEA